MRRAALLGLLLLLVLASPARAGELIDRAVAGLASDNVYVDPDADPSLSDAEAAALRDRIAARGRGADVRRRAPAAIRDEAGGDPAEALRLIVGQVRRRGTYAIVAGRTLRAGATEGVLPRGAAGEAADEAIAAAGGDPELATLLDGLVDRIGTARAEAADGGSDGGGAGTGGLVLLGLVGAGAAGLLVARRRRRRARRGRVRGGQARTPATTSSRSATTSARSTSTPRCPAPTRRRRADYDHAVERYTAAEETWEAARRPADLAPVGEALEEGRWAMASAKARFAGDDAARAPAAVLLRPAPRAVVARRGLVAAVRRAARGPGLRGRCRCASRTATTRTCARSSATASASRTGRPGRRTRRSPAASTAAGCCRAS